MTINQCQKGKIGERELADFLRERGVRGARRHAQQGSGGSSSEPDIVGLEGWHVECKRVEERSAGTIYEWLAQAERDSGRGDRVGVGLKPVVFHRRNRKKWIVVLDAEIFLALIAGLPGSLDLTDPEP
jgi:Holliday junction resolvase